MNEMKKLIVILALGFALAACASETPVPTAIPEQWDATVSALSTGLRQLPHLNSQVMETLPGGTTVDLLAITEDKKWVEVAAYLAGDSAIKGWLQVDKLRLTVSLDGLEVDTETAFVPPPTRTPNPEIPLEEQYIEDRETCPDLELLDSNPLNFPTYHVQGLAVTEDLYYISSVDRDDDRGWLFKVDRESLILLEEQELTKGALIHPGGIEMDDTYLWIPNAEYDRDGPTEILAFDTQSLEVSRTFSVNDHIGLIASNGTDRLYGANWDSVNFYVWDWDGNLIEMVANPTDMNYQDCEFSDSYLICGGTKNGSPSGTIDFIDPGNWTLVYRIEVRDTSLGHPLTREGLSLFGDEVFLLPEDGPDSEIMIYQACGIPTETQASPIPLVRAHAHNDFEHQRPLFDALDQGFTSIEVDIHLVGSELFVAHDIDDVQPGRTLISLYLDPLRERITDYGGRVYLQGPQITLLIDIKTEGEPTYLALRSILEEYQDIFTVFGPSGVSEGPILAIISGNRPRGLMKSESVRYAAYDGRIDDLGSAEPASFIPLISDKWTDLFTWEGTGPMPEQQRMTLRDIVERAHLEGRRVRFWETPDNPSTARDAVWHELLEAGVDLINTDDLLGLQRFLIANDPTPSGT